MMISARMTCATLPLFAGLLFFSGCASTKQQTSLIPEGASIELESITINATPLANNGRPVPLDIVFVYEESALKRLQGYTAEGWFTVKETNLIDWEGSVQWTSLEVAPGEQLQLTDFSNLSNKPVAITFFAGYDTRGLHRYFVVGGSRFQVQLDQLGYVVGGE